VMISDRSASQPRGTKQLTVRRVRVGDVADLLAVNREAFPADPWTRETARGWLARSRLGRNPASARVLERCIKAVRLGDAVSLFRLAQYFAIDRGARQYRIVAEVSGGVAGTACLLIQAGQGEIQSMAVRGDCRHQGLGTALLSDLLAAATSRGCQQVLLHVRADNAGARRLYRHAGFVDLETLPGFYQPSGADAVLMRKQTSRAGS
jgi:[ribosomal protein S18]-alanine N-acetyltransferase